jgi:predicted permease
LFREHPAEYSASGVQFMPLKEYVVGDVKPVLYALFGAVGFVLLIACVNVANLLLGWAARRQREVALRAALGAQRMRLIRQFLTESVLLSLQGGLLGLLLSLIGIDLLRKTGFGNLPRLQNVHINGWVFGFSLGISVLTGLVFGVLPAWSASRSGPNEALKENNRATQTKEGGRLRSLLIVSDVAFALILLTGAGLMMKSFVRLLEVNPGFDPQKVLTLQVSLFGTNYNEDAQVTAFYQQALERIETLPGVETAAVVSQIPLGGNGDMYGIHIEDKPNPNPEDDPSGDRYSITPNYFHAMHIPLLSGREFTLQDTASSSPVIIVNQTLAQSVWPGENPIGKRIRIGDPKSPAKTVVGVAGDVLHRSLNSSHTLQFYLPHTQMADSSVILAVRTSISPAALAAAVRHEIAAVDPLQPVSGVSTMEEIVAASVMQQRFSVFLFTIFAVIALLLAATGIFGVISSAVTQRTHEIGVRMALGADKQNILRLVASHGLRPALIGAVVGIVAALGLSQFLTSLLFSVKPTDPATFFSVTGILAAVAAIACYIPARRAMRVDPIVALRCE